MARLGPFGPNPHLAVAVSGGADSTALTLLTRDWLAPRDGRLLALIVDHALRQESAAEAGLTGARLTERGIGSQILSLSGLHPGGGMQAQARAARHQALAAAARAAGALFLLLGHHEADQQETAAMRAARGPYGLEAMAAWTARSDILLLRPLLAIQPETLRGFLRAQDMPWLEDPSNANDMFERVRIRRAGAGRPPADPAPRQEAERETAAFLAEHVKIRPEGFAVIRAKNMPPRALGALIRAVAGAPYAPDLTATASLAAKLRPATIGGAILAKTAKFGGDWLLAREPAACAPPVPAIAGASWDNRFKLITSHPAASFGAIGPDAPAFRHANLPSLVLRTMPCLRLGGEIRLAEAVFAPPAPVAPHVFFA
jgi:tRNA(Ile)-lysidine synthase